MAKTAAERVRDYRDRKAAGIIAECKKHPPLSVAERMRISRQRHPMRDKQKHQTVKKEVLTYYGNGKLACVSCGIEDVRCLTIDHINGNGNADRREKLGTSRGSLYWRLRSLNFPSGYQTFCMNCQFIKRFDNNEHSFHGTHYKDKKIIQGILI